MQINCFSEASPDFTKKLPYLPYLPDSVQGPGLGYPGLGPHHVYEEEEDGAADSLATDTDLPSLYSVPHKLRSESRSARGELLALVYKLHDNSCVMPTLYRGFCIQVRKESEC